MKQKITVALAGNPNSGKTTLFNSMTGLQQHVGNYPGVTVERKVGHCRYNGTELSVTDLPGTYSLSAYSAEEVIARNTILNDKPDVVVSIVDASNLERNLYLAVQLLELGVPVTLAFNMMDIVREQGGDIDLKRIAQVFNVQIVETIGHKSIGIDKLLAAIVHGASAKQLPPERLVDYGPELENEIEFLAGQIAHDQEFSKKGNARWLAIKLLEQDEDLLRQIRSTALRDALEGCMLRIEHSEDESSATLIAMKRYDFISEVVAEATVTVISGRRKLSDKIDAVVMNRYLGLPIFLGLMYAVFQMTFMLSEAPMGWIESFFGVIGDSITALWPAGSESALQSLLVDGVIGGVGGVIVFLPNILLLFLAIAILEDSGYMARVAFILDRVMSKIGLHGKSFIPMLVGFGCSVPAIMATRTLESTRDRLATMMVIPLMSCGARLPIYALIIPAFFPPMWHAPMLWIIYITGIVLAILGAKLLRVSVLKGESVPFVMELPIYRMPTLKSTLIHMWERAWLYLRKAGTVLLGISIILWAFTTYPRKTVFDRDYTAESEIVAQQIVMQTRAAGETSLSDEEILANSTAYAESVAQMENEKQAEVLAYTVTGRIGHFLQPVLNTMGFDWRIGTALIGAFAAKEVFVSQLGIVYSVGEADEESVALRDQLHASYSPLVAFCIMLFCLVSAPCMATIAVTKRESNSWKWAGFQLAGLTVLAFILTVAVFQIGSALGIGI